MCTQKNLTPSILLYGAEDAKHLCVMNIHTVYVHDLPFDQ